MSSKVMVTGAQGWLGRNLVRRLVSENREIVYVDKWKVKPAITLYLKNYRNIKFVNGDIREPQEFAKEFKDCGTLFNCAGMQHPRFTNTIYTVNRDGPVALLKMCIESNVPRFIHVSSAAVHGYNINNKVPITEKTPFRAITHCTISKAQGEKLLSKMRGKTKTVIIRPGLFYGKNPSKNLIQFIKNIKRGIAIVFDKKGFLRTNVDIDKVVDAILLAEKRGKNREAYLIGDKEPLSTIRFYGIVADAMNVKLKIKRLPKIISRINEELAYASGKLNIHLRLPTIIGEFGRDQYFSSEKAIKELSYKPHTSSEEGLKEMVRSVWKKS